MTKKDISRYAPKYHFYTKQCEHCGTFDPNGAIFWQGRYHLFYIFQNPELPHGGHCWGHASSSNLLEWIIHPPALTPRPNDVELGIFSGCALINRNGIPTLAYYGINAGCCLATALDDNLIKWQKSLDNPVVPETKGQSSDRIYNVFDPHIWVENDHYVAIFGSKVKPFLQRDTAYMFRSDDLINWEYLRPFYTANCSWTEEFEDMACPDFFKLADQYVLMGISHPCGARYYLGDYQDGTFIPTSHHRLNFPGGSLFAPESCQDQNGRRLVWFWMVDQQRNQAPGCGNQLMALPRVMQWNQEQSTVYWDIPEEYVALRHSEKCFDALNLSPTSLRLDGVDGNALELELILSHLTSKLAIRVLESADGSEYTEIVFNPKQEHWFIDSSRMGERAKVYNFYPIFHVAEEEKSNITRQQAPFQLAPGETLRIRIFIDCSIVEVFANGRYAMSQRVYPSGDDCRFVSVLTETEHNATLLRCWKMHGLNYIDQSE